MTTTEVFGDATREGEWASVRLSVRGDVIVEADAPGLDREVTGMTLLEAAAVAGEPLAIEALATALGQVFVAAPKPGRAVVAMSGGVDSAVALLRASWVWWVWSGRIRFLGGRRRGAPPEEGGAA